MVEFSFWAANIWLGAAYLSYCISIYETFSIEKIRIKVFFLSILIYFDLIKFIKLK